MTVDVDVLVLPAFENLVGLPSEVTPWRRAYDLDGMIEIDGVPTQLRYADSGLAVVPTGVGKTAATATTTALLSSDRLDLDDALVLSAGVAGGPPTFPIGSVVIADTIVDWDDKCRFDSAADADSMPLAMNPYTEDQGVFDLDAELVARARSAAEDVELRADTAPKGTAETADTMADDPVVVSGTNLCGDELWHGQALAGQATWLVETAGADPYRVTEMEDAGTAAALERFGRLDRYLSIRGLSNYDRPISAGSARESFFDPAFESGFELGLENAFDVARTVVEDRLARS